MAKTPYSFLPNEVNNRLLNSNLDIWQRGTSFSAAGYTADRWAAYGLNGTMTIARGSTNAPIGSTYYVSTTSGAGGSYVGLAQCLEATDAKKLAGKKVTFSCLMARNSTMASGMVIGVQKNSTADTLTGGSWSSLGSTVIPIGSIPELTSSSTWYRASVTVTIPSDGTANGLMFWVYYNGAPANGSAVYTAQYMLNEGSTAAPFRLQGENLAAELAMCQRYYETQLGHIYYAASGAAGANLYWTQHYKTNKRISITPSFTQGTLTNITGSAAVTNVSAVKFDIFATATAANTRTFVGVSNDASWTADAEL